MICCGNGCSSVFKVILLFLTCWFITAIFTQLPPPPTFQLPAWSSSSFLENWLGRRAFPVAGSKTRNTLPEDVTSSQSEYTFRRQLKTTRLFKKSFPDSIVWYWLHLDFQLRLVCSNFEMELSFKVYDMIWYDSNDKLVNDLIWSQDGQPRTSQSPQRRSREILQFCFQAVYLRQLQNNCRVHIHTLIHSFIISVFVM